MDEDGHEGYIARIDLDLQVKQIVYHITEDPFDVVATSDGHIVVSSGSGQHTYARVFDALTGAETGSTSRLADGTHITLHPSETKVYGADTGVSPSDIERYDLLPGGGIDYAWDSIYHGDHRMGGNIWASPRGDVVITRGGDVFTLGDTRQTDMIFNKSMANSWISALAFDDAAQLIVTVENSVLHFYDLVTFEDLGSQSLGEEARFIGVKGEWIYIILEDGSVMAAPHPRDTFQGKVANHVFSDPGFYVITLTVTDAAGNTDSDTLTVTVLDRTQPVAVAGNDLHITRGQWVRFDGSDSTDNVGIVKYTWTFTDIQQQTLDGRYCNYDFFNDGTFNVTLTVEDEAGNVGRDSIIVTVGPIPLDIHANAPKGFQIGVPQDWVVRIDYHVEDVGVVDLVVFGPLINGITTNIVVTSEIGAVKETDEFLIDEAEKAIEEIRQMAGGAYVIRQPTIVQVANSRAAVFEIEYYAVDMIQIIAIVVDEGQSRAWAIVITMGSGYSQAMSSTSDAVIESFKVIEPPLFSTPAGVFIIVLIVGLLVGLVAGVLFYRRKRGPSSEEVDDVTTEYGEDVVSEPQLAAVGSTITHPGMSEGLCTFCGARLEPPYKFCTICGSKMS
jgi:hypothetical protein